jgi:SNF2 family DNA or RNA helicase
MGGEMGGGNVVEMGGGYVVKLHAYQERAKSHILDTPKCGLFLDMGLGKTAATLSALDVLAVLGHKMLVIAPLRVARYTWPAEIAKWGFELTHTVVTGSPTQRAEALKQPTDMHIINRELVEWLVGVARPWPYTVVVIDELSSFKNRAAKRFQAIRKVLPQIQRMVGLTGTPAPNGLMDLWAQLYLLDGGKRLGKTLTAYRQKYFTPGARNGNIIYEWRPNPDAQEIIARSISDICVSMQSADYIELPEILYLSRHCALSASEAELYRKLQTDMLLELPPDEDIDGKTAAVLCGKLLQFAGGACYTENQTVRRIHNRKLEVLEDLIAESNGKNVLVYYGYRHERDAILKGTAARELLKDKDFEDWNAGSIQIAVAHPASVGHGLNLQSGGSVLVWYGLTWSLELYQQANKRLHRQGQTEIVRIYHIITTGTIDEVVMDALGRKDNIQTALLQMLKTHIRREGDGYNGM